MKTARKRLKAASVPHIGRMMGKIRKTGAYVILTAAAGAVFWAVGELLFGFLTEKIRTPLGIALYFALFGVALAAVLLLLCFRQVDMGKKANSRNVKDSYKIVALCLVAVFVLAFVFEYLYEKDPGTVPDPTSYIFLIDDSGSMSGNDPEFERREAIGKIMASEPGMPYAVYSFTGDAVLLRGLAGYSAGEEGGLEFFSSGGTDIIRSAGSVVSDLRNGRLQGAGSHPVILLLSDGSSSSFGSRRLARNCRNSGVTVCSVGFGACNEKLLRSVAESTGGAYVYCDEAENLSLSMKEALNVKTARNLLSARYVYGRDGLYCFLRILFLTLISVPWMALKSFGAYANRTKGRSREMLSLICSLAGTLALEFLSSTSFPIRLVRLLFCLLWAVTAGELAAYRSSPVVEPQLDRDTDRQTPEGYVFGQNSISQEKKEESRDYRLSGDPGNSGSTTFGGLGGFGHSSGSGSTSFGQNDGSDRQEPGSGFGQGGSRWGG